VLFNTEPVFDSAAGASAVHALAQAEMVVTLSPFKANLEFSDVLLPIAPFTETPGTFVNAEGRAQSFHAVVKPLGEARPGWKVLRVLANMLGLSAFGFESTAEVLEHLRGHEADLVPTAKLSNSTQADAGTQAKAGQPLPVVASIYQLDSIVRRAPSLQMTADGRNALHAEAPTASEALA
jgi:NADH-quinone oxidoreductase subunit G